MHLAVGAAEAQQSVRYIGSYQPVVLVILLLAEYVTMPGTHTYGVRLYSTNKLEKQSAVIQRIPSKLIFCKLRTILRSRVPRVLYDLT